MQLIEETKEFLVLPLETASVDTIEEIGLVRYLTADRDRSL